MEVQFSENVLKLLSERYLQAGETPDDMFRRVAFAVASSAKEYKNFYDLISNLQLVPSTPIFLNAGTNMESMFSCYVLGIEDSVLDILSKAVTMGLIYKGGGGVGVNLSKIRPKGSEVRTARTIASGPVSFMEIYSVVGSVVKQGSRRAATLAGLDINHPDIREFVHAKNLITNGGNESYLHNFNLSVLVDDAFMNRVKDGEEKAAKLFEEICEGIYSSGEPGLVFMDRAEASNPISYREKLLCANACAELVLTDGEACCLSAINLLRMLTTKKEMDWKLLEHTTRNAVHLLDNVISKSSYPTAEIESKVKEYRRLGIGVMGLHSMLIEMGIQYDSEEALAIAEEVMGAITRNAVDESEKIAKKVGPFPAYDAAKANFPPRRNVTLTAAQPTGATSIIASGNSMLSSGVEPFFAKSYTRDTVGGEEVSLPDWVHTALDISPEWHIRMQEALQKNIQSSISKTINLPYEATEKEIGSYIMRAWEGGIIKTMTLYRNNSREKQILNIQKGCDGGVCTI